jgi:hypothetical protein
MTENDLYTVIKSHARPEAVPFVMSSWINSYAHGGDMDKRMVLRNHRRVISLLSPHAELYLAVPLDDDGVMDGNTILGWCCRDARRGTLHYVYVKDGFRNVGLAHDLLYTGTRHGFPKEHTHETRSWRKTTYAQGSIFNPYGILPS